MKPFKVTGIQYAALPYRFEGRQLRILLITSRETGRWVIPKGWPMGGLKPQEAAAVEAAEEAGLVGEITAKPLGSYRYMKRLKHDKTMAIQVIVFPFRVDERTAEFKEQGQRTERWCRWQEAAGLVAEPSLAHSPNPITKGLRRYWAWRFGGGA
jgi:8-oxo-dGTP pyrophosphatase MutT (NUDIX family)